MYGKHFQSAYTGSMMGAGADVFAVWGYVIAHAVNGHVEINPALLKTVIGMSEKRVAAALDYLCSPDSNSRTPDEDGRRMVREGQFLYRVVNHKAYKEIRNQDERREYNREKKRESRAREKASTDVNDSQHGHHESANTEADSEAEENQRQPGTAGPKPCPHQDIIDAYHELLPTLPRIRLWQGKRKSYLAARWREEPKRQDLNWWREFFKYVAKSDFLCGLVASTGERKDQPPFMADLEWLVREGNFVKIFEGKYHRRAT